MSIISRLFNGKKRDDGKVRIKIQHFHKIKLFIEDKEFKVENISITGIGFVDNNKIINFEKNKKINAVVSVLDQLCDIEISLRHKSGPLIGARVISSCEVYKNYVEEYFQSELEGLKLKRIARESMKNTDEGEPYWLYGDSNHEIYFTATEDKVTSFQVNYHGQMVLYDGEKISTGVIWEDENEEVGYKTSALIKPADSLSKEMMEYIFRFVEVTSDINKLYKKQILELIESKFKRDWTT